jgi:flagellar assembly factor FliW
MLLSGTRFGEIELDEARAIAFPRGLIGFPDARRYALLEPRGSSPVAWLQSLDFPELAFPVMAREGFGEGYPEPAPAELAREAGLGSGELAVLVVVAARSRSSLVANLLAPLVIDLESRVGAQVVLDFRRYSAAAPVPAPAPAPAHPK